MSPNEPETLASIRGACAIRGAWSAVQELREAAPLREAIAAAIDRGYFRPAEDELLGEWLARFLSVRAGAWEVIEECGHAIGGDRPRDEDPESWRFFLVGYAAACIVVKLDRFLIQELAVHTLTQRKLNEERPQSRIPRKQYTRILESFSDVENAFRMRRVMRFASRHRERLKSLVADEELRPIVEGLGDLECELDPSKRRFLRLLLDFLSHSWRRRWASARQQTAFSVLESGGRLVSSLHDHWTPPRITPERRGELEERLRPGDVLITRHDHAVTNLFLPGFWPHAALYVGSPEDRERLGVELDEARRARWHDGARTLEARKDGVRFRPLEETLAVDAVVVIRPRLGEASIARGLERAAAHEGKLYNFDFDFFRGDRLVCTEVVYRAFDGLEDFELPLGERAGRPALAAEDLLDHALEGRLFEAIAMFGAPGGPANIVEGEELPRVLAATYRPAKT